MSILDQLAAAIQTVEGYYPPGTVVGGTSFPNGSVAYRNNNPGNLNYVGQAGATGADANGYAIFPDYATGYAALISQLQAYATPGYTHNGVTYPDGLTLNQMLNIYAPPVGDSRGINATSVYISSVSSSTGIAPDTLLADAIGGQTSTIPATDASQPGNADAFDVSSGDGSNNIFSLSDLSNFPSDVSATVQTGDMTNMQPIDWAILGAIGAVAFWAFKR